MELAETPHPKTQPGIVGMCCLAVFLVFSNSFKNAVQYLLQIGALNDLDHETNLI